MIAFAVDFSNGTIYLPDGQSSRLTHQQLEKLKLASANDTAHLPYFIESSLTVTRGDSPYPMIVKNIEHLDELNEYAKAH